MTTNNDCNLIPSVGVLRAYISIADGIAITEDESRIEPAVVLVVMFTVHMNAFK